MTTIDPKLVADVLVNLFGAFGVLVISYNLGRAGANEPVLLRIKWALRIIAIFFGVRSLAWATGYSFLLGLTDVIAAATPLAALVVAEGMLRKHAPRWLKLAMALGFIAASLTAVVPWVPVGFANVTLMLVVALGFAAVGLLLALRDRSSLTSGENASIVRLMVVMLIMVPLVVTDFRSIWPDVPVRFGAVGALALLFFSFGPSSTNTRGWERLLSLLVFSTIALLFAFGYVASGQGGAYDQIIRAAAVGVSGLICSALFAEMLGAQAERRKAADPLLEAQTAERFLDELKNHAVIGEAQLIDGDKVAHLRHDAFDGLVKSNPILKLSDAPWGRDCRDDGVERAMSLLKTYNATHALRLSLSPMRLAVFALPLSSSDARIESEIKAAQRIGEFLFAKDALA